MKMPLDHSPICCRESLLRAALRTVTSQMPAACAAVMMASPLGAQSISVNFGADQGNGSIDTSPGALPAGALPIGGEYWNNASGGSGSLGGLVDSAGSATSATVSWTANNAWGSASSGIPTATSQNATLTRGYLDDGGGIGISFNSPYLLNDIYVIHATDQGNPANMLAVSVNGTFYKGDGAGDTIPAFGIADSWSAQNWSAADTLVESDNYLFIPSQSSVNLALFNSSPGRAAVAGL